MTPSEYLFFPTKDGKWLQDSQGKPRVYKSALAAVKNLKKHQYDEMQIYTVDDAVKREDFERLVGSGDCKSMRRGEE